MNAFEDKLFIVVGASSGIGLATAQKLAREGARIVGVARNVDRLQAVIQTLEGSGHHLVVADVADEAQLNTIIRLGKEAGGYDGAVCCAGLHEMRPFSLLKTESMIASFNENVVTAINTAKAVAKAANPAGAGIVWLSSIAALRGTAGFAAYSCAKGALISAAKVAAVELAKKKIRVNVVAAGVVKTPMSEGWLQHLTPEQREQVARDHLLGLGHPDDVAELIAFLVSEHARWITGATFVADGGLSAH